MNDTHHHPHPGPRAFTPLTVPAPHVHPGDYLPPQPALHGTRWQGTGFTVGPNRGDVATNLPVESGKALLFARTGHMLAVDETATVTVHRPTPEDQS